MHDNVREAKVALEDRLAFIGLDTDARTALRDLQPVLRGAVEAAKKTLEDRIAASPEAADHFVGADANGQLNWPLDFWGFLGDGPSEAHYIAGIRRLVEAHAARGADLRWCIGGYGVVVAAVVERLIAGRLSRDQGWLQRYVGAPAVAEVVASEIARVVRAAMIDIDCMVALHVESLGAVRAGLEADRVRRQEAQDRTLAEIAGALRTVASGDLSVCIGDNVPYGFRSITRDLDEAVRSLADALRRVRAASGDLAGRVERIGQATEQLAHRTESQASNLEQSAAALHELSVSVNSAAGGATHAAEAMEALTQKANASAAVVERASDAVTKIEGSSGRISEIATVIDSIAFQTNLLAINASIEAARAGDAGRGFAAVAFEVRTLAQRCSDAARDITALVVDSGTHVTSGVALMGEMGQALRDISNGVAAVNRTIGEIAASAREQALGLQEISSAMSQIEAITQQNSSMVDQNRALTSGLREAARQLTREVEIFRIDPKREITARTAAGCAPA